MRHTQDGFTLVEVMVAIAIVTTVLVALLCALGAAAALTENARELTQAMEDGRTVLERIRGDVQASADITTFAANYPEATYEDWVAAQQAAETGFASLDSEAVSVEYGAAGDDPLGTAVTVAWQARGGRARSVTLQTQMTRR